MIIDHTHTRAPPQPPKPKGKLLALKSEILDEGGKYNLAFKVTMECWEEVSQFLVLRFVYVWVCG